MFVKKPVIRYSEKPVIEPLVGCEWADTMVLNPAIIKDPKSDLIHMLFRATGPWSKKNLRGLSNPYPIFLGYAASADNGQSWDVDFSRPALAPALEYELERMYIEDIYGNKVVNYANGCIEDPRLFWLDGECFMTVACRMFPAGPYWEGDKRRDNIPDWAMKEDNPLGNAAYKNDTTTVMFKVDLYALKARNYVEAFKYVDVLTDGNITDNRDVFFFPKRMRIKDKMQYVMLHRPDEPFKFQSGRGVYKPSMFIAAAEKLSDFRTINAKHRLLATGIFDWEEERIGASFPPIEIGGGEWLVSYHGKQFPNYGYTQSFMIMHERENDFPIITNRCSNRMMYAKQEWELPDKFLCPCLFTTGGIVKDDELIMSYGAADQKVGIAWACFDEIVDYVRLFDAQGNSIKT